MVDSSRADRDDIWRLTADGRYYPSLSHVHGSPRGLRGGARVRKEEWMVQIECRLYRTELSSNLSKAIVTNIDIDIDTESVSPRPKVAMDRNGSLQLQFPVARKENRRKEVRGRKLQEKACRLSNCAKPLIGHFHVLGEAITSYHQLQPWQPWQVNTSIESRIQNSRPPNAPEDLRIR